jgi:hypothetical protein
MILIRKENIENININLELSIKVIGLDLFEMVMVSKNG